MSIEPRFGPNALKVLERLYLKRDEDGQISETPQQMLKRVAGYVAKAELLYSRGTDVNQLTEQFYNMMASLEFLPNSPTLMNAGREIGQLSACFVLPLEDSIKSIFDGVKHTALIHKSGGGTGLSFSQIRPRGDIVRSTKGVSSGPLSFMRVFDVATETIKQGGARRGANMAVLSVDHPDIIDFITAKEQENVLTNFNLSVGLTEEFMKAVKHGFDYKLINPRTKQTVKEIPAREIFNLIVKMAWSSGEPGVLFLDRLNRDNPTPALGLIESTNPCGEQPLLPYESCNLGSINLGMMVRAGQTGLEIDKHRLQKITRLAVHFLDNVIDVNKYPLRQIEKITKGNRKIGLGVMGFADLLIQLGIPYDSEKALSVAEDVMGCIRQTARSASAQLAEKKGPFPNWGNSIYRGKLILRNATLTTIAPTGTISIVAGASSGIEPLFALAYVRHVFGGEELLEYHPLFFNIANEHGLTDKAIIEHLMRTGGVRNVRKIPKKIQDVFVTAHDISAHWHVRMQAAFQKHTDNAVSKTVNLPYEATTTDLSEVFLLAFDLGCKGITVYRDRSRTEQALSYRIAGLLPQTLTNCQYCKDG